VIVYLHGNASSRCEGAQHAKKFLSNDYNIFVFDFIGCGHSDGEFITLGAKEQYDIKPIIEYLKSTKLVPKIILYGWSMGAATALLYMSKNPDPLVAGIVIDSPFAKLSELVKDIMNSIKIPDFFFKGFYAFAKENLKLVYDFDIDELNPMDGLEKVKVPAIFLHSVNDTLIPIKHSEMIYKQYGGPKENEWFSEKYSNDAHNAPRPPVIGKRILKFIKNL